MFGIPTVDLVVIVVYSVLMVVLGFVAMRRVRNQEDYFLGGRRFGKFLQTFSAFGQATSTENVVGAVTTTYRDGAGGIWSTLTLLWTTPIYWVTAPWYRRMRVLTMGDFFHERYGSRRMAMLYSTVASFYMLLMIGVGLKAMSVTVVGMTLKPEAALHAEERKELANAMRLDELALRDTRSPLVDADKEELKALRIQHPRREFSYFDETWLTWFIVLVVFLYCTTGGLEAAVWTDTVQGVLILILSVLLIPFAMVKLNSLHGLTGIGATGRLLHQELPGHFFSPLGSPLALDFTWYFIVALCVMASLNVAVQANQLTAIASARDEHAGRLGFTAGTMMKRYCTVAWGGTALLCYALYSREVKNPDYVWGHATRDLLGGLGIGLVGLMIAAMFAALQSTASTLMISASSLFTKNVYEVLTPGRSERHYVFVGRVVGTVVLAGSALLSTAFGSVLEMLKFLWEFNALVAAAFWCGLKWRRATRAGAWAAMLTAVVLFVVLPVGLPAVFRGMRTDDALLRTTRQRVTQHEYTASRRDVEEREREITSWRGPGEAPPQLREGEKFTRPVIAAPRSIYWAQGIEWSDGTPRGRGMFNPELYVLDQLFDLSANPFALNETIRYCYKILMPFLVLIVVSLLTRPEDIESTKRFFLRMRTKVRTDRAEDERVVQDASANPESTRSVLLFPNSQLELFTWDREDVTGFVGWSIAAAGVLGLLWLIVSVGA